MEAKPTQPSNATNLFSKLEARADTLQTLYRNMSTHLLSTESGTLLDLKDLQGHSFQVRVIETTAHVKYDQ